MNLKRQAISGVRWSSISTVILAVCAILKISILTRFLDQSDFGLMALIMFAMGFMDLFMDMGLTSAILHKQNINSKEYSSLYWLNVVFSLIIFALIFSVSPLISRFYDERQLKELIPLMALGIIFSAVGRQYKTILQKELKFRTIAVIDILAVTLSLSLAIYLAVNGFNVLALVYSSLFQYFLSNVLYFSVGTRTRKLSFHFSFMETKPFLKIGMYQVGGQVINYFNRDIDILIIGKFFGAELLGGYSLAKQLVRRPLGILDPIIIKVANAILPKFQNDKGALLKYFTQLNHGFGVMNGIVYGAIAITAPILVSILYGNDYLHIVDIVRILAALVYFRSIAGIVATLAITKGRTDLEFYWNIMTTAIFPIAIFFGVDYGIIEVALFLLIAQMVLLIPMWYIFYRRLTGMRMTEFLKAIMMPFCVAICIFIIFYNLSSRTELTQIIASVFLGLCMLIYTYFSSELVKQVLTKNFIKICRVFRYK